MNGVTLVLRALHQGERDLVDGLVALAERHRAEHEVHHVATDVATWSREHVRRLADTAAHYGLDLDGPDSGDPDSEGPDSDGPDLRGPGLDGPPGGSSPDLFAAPRKKAPDPAGGPSDPGLLLLRDLREAHLAAAHNSLHWEMLAQAAQALRDHRLLALASFCHPRTLRQMRWTNTMIKNLSPQLLTSL
ncbi:hypothetical protein [Streptomyces sp. NPDC012825]|uniref:hypothetical protein n=1 Tax=Streptomyces sp. NPDC012825 TaxID=3364851 RepID=UPI0036C05D24